MYIVIGNGDWDSLWGRTILSDARVSKVVCADGGANAAIAADRIPDVLIGDLDSIEPQTLKICQDAGTLIRKYASEKDETDMELALKWAHRQAGEEEIVLCGANGGRIDHLLGNIGLLIHFAQQGRRIRMLDAHSQTWVLLPGREDFSAWCGSTVSIIALGSEAKVSAAGVKYPLQALTLRQTSPRGISNIIQENAWIEVESGVALVVLITNRP